MLNVRDIYRNVGDIYGKNAIFTFISYDIQTNLIFIENIDFFTDISGGMYGYIYLTFAVNVGYLQIIQQTYTDMS